jgi:ribosomal protein S12 methylthiotransferase
MKAKGNKKVKVNIVTLGCSKNLVDSENIFTQLRGNGIDVSHEAKNDQSNVVIVNTCGFIDNAKQESIDTILRYVDAKEQGVIDKLYVTGCLSQRYKDDLEKEMPTVDAFFGTNELAALLKRFKADYKHELVGERFITTPKHFAYMKIAEGCDRPCSFCAIPLMRGKNVSRSIDELVTEATNHVKNGTKEVILIAQDLTYYGLDNYGERSLAKLLIALSDVAGLEWIRLQYAYPSQFPEEVLPIMRERANICNYLDMPLQHASTEMLKIMRRGISRQRTEELLATIRKEVPGIAIRTTLIVGHPGETEEQFQQLCDFVKQQRFERLGVFQYSHEENTHAFSLVDSIPAEEKQRRADVIMEIQEAISTALNQEKIGKNYKVLIDRKEGGYFIGRTEQDSPEVDNEVLIEAKDVYLRLGDFVNVVVDDATEFDLYASVVK